MSTLRAACVLGWGLALLGCEGLAHAPDGGAVDASTGGGSGGGGGATTQGPFSRKIEFIGDSIFAGYGNEGCPFSVGTQNEYLSVGAITARALSAEHITLAWSGMGMSISYDGGKASRRPVSSRRSARPRLWPGCRSPSHPTALGHKDRESRETSAWV